MHIHIVSGRNDRDQDSPLGPGPAEELQAWANANGTTNGTANGTANGAANSTANGTANGTEQLTAQPMAQLKTWANANTGLFVFTSEGMPTTPAEVVQGLGWRVQGVGWRV